MTLTQILSTDSSDTARHALDYACELARRFDASVHLLHVVADPMQNWAVEAMPVVSDLADRWKADAERRLEALRLDELQTVRAVRVGHAFVEILQHAGDNAIDMIVMGTHGRGPVEHLLLGSVAEKVVRKASCPVLAVKQAGHVFVMPAVPVSPSAPEPAR